MQNLTYLSPKTIVKESPIHNKGLFAAEAIKKRRDCLRQRRRNYQSGEASFNAGLVSRGGNPNRP
ncbi:MAG: hypothetical protein M3384_10475 [Acidobacteriota bacterium]|nr:hypothetical protein [Acidobacteriota bacterium]